LKPKPGMTAQGLGRLSVALSVVLLLTYVLFLTFALVTHPALFAGSVAVEEEKAPASVSRSMLVLVAATVGIAWMSEILVAAVEPTTLEFGFGIIGGLVNIPVKRIVHERAVLAHPLAIFGLGGLLARDDPRAPRADHRRQSWRLPRGL
jgi:calcium/proton exchanger cax